MLRSVNAAKDSEEEEEAEEKKQSSSCASTCAVNKHRCRSLDIPLQLVCSLCIRHFILLL